MKIKQILTVFLCIVLSCNFTMNVKGADSSKNIRVGLISCYSGLSSIRIENNSIVMGYSSNNSYSSDATLTSSSGFTFSVDNGYYYESDNNFATLDTAKGVADNIASMGYTAYPAIEGVGNYKVYVGGVGSLSELESIENEVQGLGYIFSKKVLQDNLRIRMTFDDTKLIIDATNGSYPQFKATTPNQMGDYVVSLGEREYRGRIEIGRYGNGSLTAVNIVDIEEYLYGVVPCEMVSSWNIEALKAQAVCARSYAYLTATYTSDTAINKGYSLVDTTASQVYKGYLSEKESTNSAVDLTHGKMIYYKNEVVKGYYFSTSGGSTENIEDVWNTPINYLRSVSDVYELFPAKKPWIVELTKSEISSKLSSAGLSVGNISDVTVDIMTQSQHAYSVRFTGSAGKTSISGDKVRTILSLPSTKVKVVKSTDNPDNVTVISKDGQSQVELKDSYAINADGETVKISSELEQVMVLSKDNITNFPTIVPSSGTYYFAGQGSGHSVGLSQSGAKGMADAGYNYEEILQHYYTGITVK